ncbi:putative Ig family protein [Verrucomicrobia bacterium]|nr:putative Ig family protein [Verrucomicrobiota bacterium]
MLRFVKVFGCLAALTLSFPSARAFSLLGPLPTLTPGADQWEATVLGYALPFYVDIGTPKNLGEEYRRNTPVMYYACDATFLDYFGSNGVQAIDDAFAVFNSLTNVSTYSPDLSEFPNAAREVNYEAQFLSMLDLKTETMRLILENLGLAEPERYTWGLHTRFLPPGGTCPFDEEYLVIQRNFDPVLGYPASQLIPSSYVNDTEYTYQVLEACTGPDPLAVAVPFPVDPNASVFTSVAGSYGTVALPNATIFSFLTPFGAFLTDLTRDDVGGLRFLLSTNTINFESAGTFTLAQTTNTTPQLLITSNLTLFAQQALTNSDAALLALYPGLVLAAPASNSFVLQPVTTLTAYFTNLPWEPAGFFTVAFTTNITLVPEILYTHYYANLFVLGQSSNGLWNAQQVTDITPLVQPNIMTVQNILVTASPFGIPGEAQAVTNTTTRHFLTNMVSGEFVLLPTNGCGVAILSTLLTNVVSLTNTLVFTNAATATNIIGVTNSFTQNVITTQTNHFFVYDQIICTASNTALYQGIERITFYRRDFDSLLGRFFQPITNYYILNSITNNAIVPQVAQRVVTVPDFLLEAADLAGGPGTPPISSADARSINFNANFRLPGLAGPGTIEPPTLFTYNKVGPNFVNYTILNNTNAFLTQLDFTPVFIWGSFDGTTNAPIVYPNGASIADLENQIFIQITPGGLPSGSFGAAYSVQLQSQGQTASWVAPYTFAVASASPGGLPPGLTISSRGLISGTPSQSGDYNFVLQVTDADGRTINRNFDIYIP